MATALVAWYSARMSPLPRALYVLSILLALYPSWLLAIIALCLAFFLDAGGRLSTP